VKLRRLLDEAVAVEVDPDGPDGGDDVDESAGAFGYVEDPEAAQAVGW
jgi:hypothetical protein